MRPAECVASCIEAPTTMTDEHRREGRAYHVGAPPPHPLALTCRDLSYNDLSGPIPAEIGQLTKLREL